MSFGIVSHLQADGGLAKDVGDPLAGYYWQFKISAEHTAGPLTLVEFSNAQVSSHPR